MKKSFYAVKAAVSLFFILSANIALPSTLNFKSNDGKLRDADTNYVASSLNQVVVTGTGTHRKLRNSPVPIEIISGDLIKKSGAVNFEGAMNLLNPSFIFTSNAMNDKISLNGLEGKYILLLIDGRRVTGDISGSIDISRIDMNNVKRIEILKGSASSLYGSDAIGGVINIITERPKSPVELVSTTRTGSFAQFTQGINATINAGGLTSNTAYRRARSDGWQLSNQEITTDKKTGAIKLIPTEKQAVNAYLSDVLNQNFTYNFTDSLSAYINGSYYSKIGKRPLAAYAYDMNYKDFNLGAGAKYLTGDAGYYALDLSWNSYEYSKEYNAASGTFIAGDNERSKLQIYKNVSAKRVVRLGRKNKFSFGADYTHDFLITSSLVERSKGVAQGAVYIQDEINLPYGFETVAGVRYTYHETFKSNLSPKISLMKKLGKFTTRASYSTGFKAPTITELYYDYESRGTVSRGNIDLKPEMSNYFALNSEFGGNLLYGSITVYVNNLKDMIGRKLVPVTPEEQEAGITKSYRYENISQASVKGVDLNFTFIPCSFMKLAGGYGYTYTRDLDNLAPISGTALHSATINLNLRKDWKRLSTDLNINGKYQSERFYLNETPAPPHQLWNITLTGKYHGFKKFEIEPSAGIENIFNYKDDRPYGSNYATLSPGRTWFLALTFKFTHYSKR